MFLAQPPQFHLWIPGAPFSPHGRGRARTALQPIKNAPRRNFYCGARIPAELRFRPSSWASGEATIGGVGVGVEKIVASPLLCLRRDRPGESGFEASNWERLLVREGHVLWWDCSGFSLPHVRQRFAAPKSATTFSSHNCNCNSLNNKIQKCVTCSLFFSSFANRPVCPVAPITFNFTKSSYQQAQIGIIKQHERERERERE